MVKRLADSAYEPICQPCLLFVLQVLSHRQRVEEEHPVGGDGSDESAAEVGEDSLRREVAVAERVEHGGVSAEEAAPAHADGGKDGDGVAVNPAVRYEVGYQAERSAYSTERRDGERHEVRVVEAEEPLEHEVDFVGKPRQQLHTLIGGARVRAVGRRAEREYHHERRDDEHAGDDGYAHFNAAASAVEHGVEQAYEHGLLFLRTFLFLFFLYVLLRHGVLRGILRISLQHEALHEARRTDAAEAGAEQTDEWRGVVALTRHEHDDEQTHAERRTEVGERDELVFLEVACEALVVCKRDDGGVVGEERHHGAQRRHARQVEDRSHQRSQRAFEQRNHAELHEHPAYGAGYHADAHQIEYGVEQQVVRRAHDGVEHVGHTHHHAEVAEEHYYAGDAPDAAWDERFAFRIVLFHKGSFNS